jgi:huntingtin-interacting protein 1-related protein
MSGSTSLPMPATFSTQPIWSALKDQPVLANEIMCFKALILIHCLLVEGPQMLLTDAIREIPFLDECARRFHNNRLSGTFYLEFI